MRVLQGLRVSVEHEQVDRRAKVSAKRVGDARHSRAAAAADADNLDLRPAIEAGSIGLCSRRGRSLRRRLLYGLRRRRRLGLRRLCGLGPADRLRFFGRVDDAGIRRRGRLRLRLCRLRPRLQAWRRVRGVNDRTNHGRLRRLRRLRPRLQHGRLFQARCKCLDSASIVATGGGSFFRRHLGRRLRPLWRRDLRGLWPADRLRFGRVDDRLLRERGINLLDDKGHRISRLFERHVSDGLANRIDGPLLGQHGC